MRIFVTVLLATVAIAAADISLGYNYPGQGSNFQQNNQQPALLMHLIAGTVPQSSVSSQHQQQQFHAAQSPQQFLPNLQQQAQRFQQQQPQQHASIAAAANYPMPSGFPATTFVVPAKTGRRLRPRAKAPKKAIVTKNFFIHAAPEESDEELHDELSQLSQQPRKHYNVLFVKTPAQTSKAAAINLAKALNEEKTVVYVLSKKTTAADLQEAINDAPQHINKPEVFFIKYRTPEEATHAQRQIQSQYDSLGGTSTITDEGVAPVTSVVGSLDAPEEDDIADAEEASLDEQAGNNNNNIGNDQYLPPSNRF